MRKKATHIKNRFRALLESHIFYFSRFTFPVLKSHHITSQLAYETEKKGDSISGLISIPSAAAELHRSHKCEENVQYQPGRA